MSGSCGRARPLRICLVAASMDILGGQAVQAAQIMRGFEGDGDVEILFQPINPRPPGPLRYCTGIKYLRTIVVSIFYWIGLVRIIPRADVVHIFSASYLSFFISPFPAIVMAKLFRRPVLLNYHSGEADDHLRRWGFLVTGVLRWVERIVVPSEYLREVFSAHGLKADVVPNAMDLARFRFRKRYPLRPVILSTRNLEPMYKVDNSIRAFGILKSRYPEARLVIVGFGSEESRLRSMVASLSIKGVVFAGKVPHESIHRYYDNADIMVNSSEIDNMPLSVMEAFASGTPIVSTQAGGIRNMIEDGENGLIVAMRDPDEMADAVSRLLGDPDLAGRLAGRALMDCRRFRWDQVRMRWVEIYRELCGRGGGNEE